MELLIQCKIMFMRILVIVTAIFAFGCKEGTVELTYSSTQDNCGSVAGRDSTFANSDSGGNGTTVPYKICTTQQFLNISTAMNANFEIVNDLDFSSTPVTTFTEYFEGSIEGNGYTLSNVTVSGDGLFDRATAAAQFNNFTMDNWEVSGVSDVGALVGFVLSTDSRPFKISNIKARNISVTATGTDSGGLIGHLGNSTVTPGSYVFENLEFSGSISGGSSNVGGLIGQVYKDNGALTVSGLKMESLMQGTGTIGGVVGFDFNGRSQFNDLELYSRITLTNSYAGGVVGRITGNSNAVTISGIQGSVTIVGSSTSTSASVGGLVGYIFNGDLDISDAQMTLSLTSAGSNLGGFVAYANGGGLSVKNSSTNIVASAVDRMGGIVGYKRDDTFDASNVQVDFEFPTSRNYISGFTGYSYDAAITIDGITVSGSIINPTNNVGGLFGTAARDPLVAKNVKVNMIIGNAEDNIGGLVGFIDDSEFQFSGSTDVAITISSAIFNVGGGVGASDFSGAFLGGDYVLELGAGTNVGGVLGVISDTSTRAVTFSGLSVQADLKNTGRYVGGLAGEVSRNSVIENITIASNIQSDSDYVSLGVGNVGQDSRLSNVTGRGTITGSPMDSDFCGGIAGYTRQNVTIINADIEANLSCRDNVGGIVGYSHQFGGVSVATFTGSLSAGGSSGGIVGYSRNSTLTELQVSATINTTLGELGGVVGYLDTGTMTNVTASVTLTTTSNLGGGVVGYLRNSTLSDASVSGALTGAGGYVGGLVGNAFSSTGNSISRVYSTMNLSGSNYVGGLVGYYDSDNSFLEDCFYSGTLTSTGSVGGGLIGRITGGQAGSIRQCYSNANIPSSGANTGPVYGLSTNTNRIDATSTFYNSDQPSGEYNNTVGTGLTSIQMINSFNFVGFDFITPDWVVPAAGYVLPGAGSYSFPVPESID